MQKVKLSVLLGDKKRVMTALSEQGVEKEL